MKKLATLAACVAVSATAAAQSQVTLFGVVDAAARYVKNDDLKIKSLSSNGLSTSRIGVRGLEDLGDGFKAGFWLEGGLNIDDGTQSDAKRFWNRRSTVSLIGSFGELRLGRDYAPTYQGYEVYDVFTDNGVAASSKFDASLGTARDTGTRVDNEINYLTPDGLGGFYARASVAAGEGTAGKKYVGGRAGYGTGPIDVSISYGQTTVAPVNGDDKFKTFDLGGSYDFGRFKVMGYYAHSKFVDLKQATYSIGATMQLGVAGILRAQFTHVDASGTTPAGVNTDANDANQFALGYVYNLSKRTALYSTVARVKNKGAAAFAVASNPPMAAGETSTGAEFGLRHSF